MARLIPPVKSFADIGNRGERLVAEALVEQLSDEVVIYHSFPWLNEATHAKTGARYLQPGEVDFVVVDPTWGLLVLEVKASEVTYEPSRNVWRQKDRRSGTWHDIAPFRQAEKSKHALLERLQAHRVFEGPPPFTVGHAVVFPDHRFVGELPAHVKPEILLGASSLATMRRSIHRAFESWCRVPNPHPLTSQMRGAILEALSPVFKLIPVLWRTLDRQEERLHQLTERQAQALDLLQHQERMAIEGVAGSGKTLLAVAQAQRLAREGHRTLLLCFNRPLANWLRSNVAQAAEEVVIDTFHGLCESWAIKAGLGFGTTGLSKAEKQDFFRYEAPELLIDAADALAATDGFDAIVVDEGQDFDNLWWLALQDLYRDPDAPRRLTVFHDPRQCIYQASPEIPEMGRPFSLTTNCRNTREIADYSAGTLGFVCRVLPGTPKGDPPSITRAGSAKEAIAHARKVVQNWCLADRGGLSYDRVAILRPWEKGVDAWPDRFGNIPLVRDFEAWRRGEGVLLSTQRRFKGLEADALVLAEMPEPGSNPYYTEADHYVATSRAKHLLEVIHV